MSVTIENLVRPGDTETQAAEVQRGSLFSLVAALPDARERLVVGALLILGHGQLRHARMIQEPARRGKNTSRRRQDRLLGHPATHPEWHLERQRKGAVAGLQSGCERPLLHGHLRW